MLSSFLSFNFFYKQRFIEIFCFLKFAHFFIKSLFETINELGFSVLGDFSLALLVTFWLIRELRGEPIFPLLLFLETC